MKQIKALIFDLDGTAIPSKVDGMPSQAVIQAVKEAREHCHVSIATGRPYPYAKSIIEMLGIDDLCILSGGATIYSIKERKNVWQQQMDPKGIEEVLFPLRTSLGDHEVETDVESFRKFPLHKYKPNDRTSMVCIYAVTASQAEEIIKHTERVSGFVAHAMTSWTPGKLDVHITHELATKKHALQALLARLSVDHHQCMVVGDGGNDLPLFEVAGIKVAMDNGSELLKAQADWIAPSVDNDGLARAIEHFITHPIGV